MADLTSRLILTLIDHVTGPARNVHQAIAQVQGRIERNNQAIAAARGDLLGAAGAAVAFAAAMTGPVRAAMRFEEALADVTKVADFSVPGSYEEFTQGLRDLSREVPIAVDGLAEIAAAGAQSGIATEDLLKFTAAAAKIGVAFDISAGEAGSALASLMAGLGVTLDEAILLADGMNHLSNAQNSSAADILDVQLRVGALGEQFGFANEQVSAFASAMISGGFAPERVATAFANMGYALTAGANATKRQKDAFEALGMSAEQVNRDMQEDAVGTTLKVMEALAALPAELRSQTAVALFGREADALIPLLGNLDLLRESLGLVEEEASYAGSAFTEFMNRNRTFAMRLQRFMNVMTNLSIVIGQALIPGLTTMMDRLQPILEIMIDWVEANGDLVRTIAQVIGSLIGLRVALAAIRLVGLTGRGGYLWLLANGLQTVGRAGSSLAGATREAYALQAALAAMSGANMTKLDAVRAGLRGIAGVTGLSAAASAVGAVAGAVAAISAPVWLTVAAVAAAVGAAGYAIWRWWDRLTSIFQGVAAAIWDALQPALAWLGPAVEAIRPYVQPVIDTFNRMRDAIANVGERIRGAFDSVVAFFSGLDLGREVLTPEDQARIRQAAYDITSGIIAAFKSLGARLYAAGLAAIQRLWDGMQERGGALLEWASGWAQSVADAILGPIADAMESAYGGGAPAPDPSQATDAMGNPIPGRAGGGPIWPGRAYRVGERGEELIFPSRAGYVVAAEQTRRLMAMARQITAPAPASLAPRSLAGDGGARPVAVTFGDIVIQGGANASAEDISRAIARDVGVLIRSDYRLDGAP